MANNKRNGGTPPGGAVRGGRVGSIDSLRNSLKRGGGSQYLTRIPGDGNLTVRFITEPEEWIAYFEHYDSVRKFYPCMENDCPGCLEGERPSARYLSNAVDRTNNSVVPLVLAKSLAGSLLKKYDRFGTLLDRDYDLARTGTGFDTEYDVTPEPPTKVNLDKYEAIDLWELLLEQLGSVNGDATAKTEPEPPAKKTPAKRTPAKKPEPEPVEEEAEEEDEEEPEEESSEDSEYYTKAELAGKKPTELRKMLTEWNPFGFSTAQIKALSADDLVGYLTGEKTATDEDEEEEDEESYSEEDLSGMSVAELRVIGRQFGLKIKPSAQRDQIVQQIMEAQGEQADEDEEVPF